MKAAWKEVYGVLARGLKLGDGVKIYGFVAWSLKRSPNLRRRSNSTKIWSLTKGKKFKFCCIMYDQDLWEYIIKKFILNILLKNIF